MADDLRASSASGHLLYKPSTGDLVYQCAEVVGTTCFASWIADYDYGLGEWVIFYSGSDCGGTHPFLDRWCFSSQGEAQYWTDTGVPCTFNEDCAEPMSEPGPPDADFTLCCAFTGVGDCFCE